MSDNIRQSLLTELLEAFVAQGYEIKGMSGDERFHAASPVPNDGYGDQKPKRPPILAFDSIDNCFIIGIARISYDDLSNEESLTEYDVFLDQVDPKTGKPFKLFVILPPRLVGEFNGLIHHYIHRDYWHRIITVAARSNVN